MSSPAPSRTSVLLFLGCLSLLSAFLLFQVQPVISKYILPWFGGSPGVWTTCMVFFQAVLFAGYAYAHVLTRFPARTQALVHGGLLLAALVFLPIAPGDGWKPEGTEDPAGRILLLLLGTVGLPYFILSSTSPLTQVWFTRVSPGGRPWRLYALSNLGSLAALLSYPFFFEPMLDVTQQTWLWSGAFVVFAALSAVLAWKTAGLAGHGEAAAGEPPAPGTRAVKEEPAPRWWHRLLWVALPALASAMLLATTNHVCQDVAVVPFMWVVPLSLYLLTFILCFEHERWYARWLWAPLGLAVIFVTAGEPYFSGSTELMPDYVAELAWCFGALFLGCMLCHGELARLKPGTGRLTEFYLLMSAGGALGGLLVSLVAPRQFDTFMEWPLGLMLCLVVAAAALFRAIRNARSPWLPLGLGAAVLLIFYTDWQVAKIMGNEGWIKGMGNAVWKPLWKAAGDLYEEGVWRKQLWPWWLAAAGVAAWAFWSGVQLGRQKGKNALSVLAEGCVIVLLGGMLHFLLNHSLEVVKRMERVRNFYGTVYVDEDYDDGLDSHYRTLTHGGIVHGMQNLAPQYREEPVTYYGRDTGIGKALTWVADRPGAKVGVVGLGAGTAACYARAGHDYRFYEINPDVVRLAKEHFTYLSDAERRGATVETLVGDARLVLEKEPDQGFDVLLLDAFSGDAIPMHLLTREAFQIYERHMKPDGIIVVHVTNSYLILAPVVQKQAEALNWKTTRRITEEEGDHDSTDYMMLTRDKGFLRANLPDEPIDEPVLDVPLWTDRYHNLFQILMHD